MRLSSPDPAVAKSAAEEILRSAERAEPLSLMTVATVHLARAGRLDDAVFWFYAGQLRARYAPRLKGENSQLLGIFITAGEPINAHAQKDILAMDRTMQRVLAWDAQTYPAWAKANGLDAADPTLAAERAKARAGLDAMMRTLKANREHYEKQAREYKSPEDRQRETREALAERMANTRALERVIDGRTLRLPANYFSRVGLEEPARKDVRDLTLTLFLPELTGFRKDTPHEFTADPSVMLVRINDPNERRNTIEMFEAFIATTPPTVRVFGADAYFFDERNNPARVHLPLYGYSKEYVFRHPRAGREPVYMSCGAPDAQGRIINRQCRLFMRHGASGLRLNATFSQAYGAAWTEIARRLDGLLDTWHVPGGRPKR